MLNVERELGRAFKVELEKNEYLFSDNIRKQSYTTRFKVYLNKHVPTNTQKFGEFWDGESLPPEYIQPPQPEIDMILVDNQNRWHAVELKVIKKTKQRIFPSYYFGLGQTLAYLSFGFDDVAIWQCFDSSTLNDEEISSYKHALTRIWEPVRPLAGVTFFKIEIDNGKTLIQTDVGKWQEGVGKYDPTIEKYGFSCVSGNPSLNDAPQVKATRKFLEMQKTKCWDKY